MFITKKALARRTFLRGIGATLALPLLDSMVPALSAAPKSTPRLGFVYVPNGIIQEQWFPKTPGPLTADLPAILKPLAAFREQINVMGNMAHLQANTFGDGVGDHPRASAVWLSGVHAWDRTRPGMEVRLGVQTPEGCQAMVSLVNSVFEDSRGEVFAWLDERLVPRRVWTTVYGITVSGQILPQSHLLPPGLTELPGPVAAR